MSNPPRRALDAPAGDLAIISRTVVASSVAYSRESPRRRVIQPFHKSAADPLHRMLNAVQPDSYVRPHRHLDPPKAEAWIVLQGALVFFTFENDGVVRDGVRLVANGENFGVDLAPGVYHSFVALEPDTVIYEVKTGPYSELDDKSFAPWAPAEGQPEAADYMRTLIACYQARQG